MSKFSQYPAPGPLLFSTFSAFPAAASNGQLALALDTDSLYAYNTTSSTWVIIGGGSVPLSIGTFDGQAPAANGASLALNQLFMQSATATVPGLVNVSTQTFAGNKTFTGAITASNLSGTNTGDVTLAAFGSTPSANAASLSGQILTLQPADATHPGGVSIGSQTFAGDKTFTGDISATSFTGDVNTSQILGIASQATFRLVFTDQPDPDDYVNIEALFQGTSTFGSFGGLVWDDTVAIGADLEESINNLVAAIEASILMDVYDFGGGNTGTPLQSVVADIDNDQIIFTVGTGVFVGTGGNLINDGSYSGICAYTDVMDANNISNGRYGFEDLSGPIAPSNLHGPTNGSDGSVSINTGAVFDSSGNLKIGGGSDPVTHPLFPPSILVSYDEDAAHRIHIRNSVCGVSLWAGGSDSNSRFLIGTDTDSAFQFYVNAFAYTPFEVRPTGQINCGYDINSMSTAQHSPDVPALSCMGAGDQSVNIFEVLQPGGTALAGVDSTYNLFAANLSGTNTGDVTLTAVGSSPDANGATLSGQALTLQPADATHPGLVTADAQTFGGAKTFSNPIVGTQSQGDSSTKAASTAYVDVAIANAVAGVNPAVAVQAATTAAGDTSGYTYNNGVSGVGATLTGANNTALTVDGYTFTAIGQRLLVKNDTQSPSGAFNGVYSVTQVQATLLPLILTRALDYNTPSHINNTGAIPVINGTVNGTTQWVVTSTVNTVGTDPLTFTKFSNNPATEVIGPSSSNAGGLTLFDGTTGKLVKEATLTQHNMLIAGANNTVTSLAPSTAKNFAASDGTDWTSRAIAGTDLPAVPSVTGSRTSSSQAVTTSATIVYNTDVDDPFNMLNTGTGVITLNRAGVWLIAVTCMFDTIAAGTTNANAVIRLNATTDIYRAYFAQLGSSTTIQAGSFSVAYRFAANDAITITANGDASFNVEGTNSPTSNWISATWMGP